MSRLTEKDENGNWSVKGIKWENLYEGQEITKEIYEKLYGALWKLMEYEDTGLTPEEINSLNEFENSNEEKLLLEIAKHKWIPVEERLPDDVVNPITRDSYVYPVTVDLGGITDVRYYSFCRGHWYNQGPKVMDDLVIAWMPLPEPYYKDWKKDMCPNNRTCSDCPLEIQRNV